MNEHPHGARKFDEGPELHVVEVEVLELHDLRVVSWEALWPQPTLRWWSGLCHFPGGATDCCMYTGRFVVSGMAMRSTSTGPTLCACSRSIIVMRAVICVN